VDEALLERDVPDGRKRLLRPVVSHYLVKTRGSCRAEALAREVRPQRKNK
jgi:hypothetical protein